LKRDINLLPANESTVKLAHWGTIALAVLVGALMLAYFAILLPGSHLTDLQNKVTSLDNQAAMKAGVNAQFDASAAKRKELQGIRDALDKSDKEYIQPADMFAQLTKACPDSITVLSVTIDNAGATIIGRAPDDKEIAQFIENLKTIPAFQNVGFTIVQEDYSMGGTVQQKRVFGIKAEYLPAATPSTPQATPVTTQQGGGVS
jgi:Tfp pilus assembly protein PilN